jgi:membrane associated rhomboid family serine protease
MIFAVNLENKIGTKNIILLYVVGGIISSIVCDFVLREKYLNFILEYQNLKPQTHIDVIAYKIRLDDNINYNNSYGASGSVCGVMIAYFAFNVLAWKKILFNLFILFFTYKTIILLSFDSTGTHSNHLGGMIGGGIVALILLVIKNKNGVKINLTPNSLLVKN